MKIKCRKLLGFLLITILIMIIAVLVIITDGESFADIAIYVIGGLVINYMLFAFTNIIKSFIKSKYFKEKLLGE